MQVLEGALSVAVSAIICWCSVEVQVKLQLGGFLIPIATAFTVALATLLPRLLAPLESSAESIAGLLMMFFFSAIGCATSAAPSAAIGESSCKIWSLSMTARFNTCCAA